MGQRRDTEPDEGRIRRPPATTPEAREDQLISLATDLAEKQMVAGTASAQVISYYLKLGSSREKLEQERLQHENELLVVKKDAIAASARVEELYAEAIEAFRGYQPHPTRMEYDED